MAKNRVQIPQTVKGEDQLWWEEKKKKATLWCTGNMKPNYVSSTFGLEDFQVYDNYWEIDMIFKSI